MVVVSMSHLEEGPVDLHHLILEGPVGIPEVPACVLDLFSNMSYIYFFACIFDAVYLHRLGLHGDSECCLSSWNKQGAWPQI